MTQLKLYNLLKNNERYKGFTILDEPVKFNKFFVDKNIDTVLLHSIEICDDGDILGFCGACKWKNNTLTPIDHDTYYEDMLVYGYEWWENKEEGINVGLDILVD